MPCWVTWQIVNGWFSIVKVIFHPLFQFNAGIIRESGVLRKLSESKFQNDSAPECAISTYYPDLFPDLSEPPFGDEHADECVADYMNTSQSYYYNRYGWSWFSDVGPAMEDYSRQALGPSHDYVFTENLYMLWDGSLNWNRFRAEIDAGRPMVLLVDTDGNGSTDHFVTAVGYGVTDDLWYYGCLNTWDSDVHWFEFAPMAKGQAWGVFGGITFRIATLDNHIFCPLVSRDL